MSKSLVSLTTNPCKMCMPMGVMTAFYGISKCMTILHGSQGCSTYIRRHMATHYNEPIDIASSSLTEEGTVYGGEKNLIKGIENLITLYKPEVIGIGTTCLAETIGEDLTQIIKNFYAGHPESKVKLIPVPSGGYMGTQYEGFFRALHSIVEHVEMDTTPHNKINVITGPISPADTRYLKNLFKALGVQVILLPDISDNLDGGHSEFYKRLPEGGTTLQEIAQMAGARATIELTTFVDESYSPGKYLEKVYGVPYTKHPLPVGLRDTDTFMQWLTWINRSGMPRSIKEERARYVDAMIDSHKYNAEGRACVFGEPDFVYNMTRLCSENGIMPVVTAVGTKCPGLSKKLKPEIESVAEKLFIEEYISFDEADFEKIEEAILRYKANLMIGSSEARRIEERRGIHLVRCAFPIHDRIGGQRIRTLGYEGGLLLLDAITNTIIANKEGSFRNKLYTAYYHKGEKSSLDQEEVSKMLEEKTYSKVEEEVESAVTVAEEEVEVIVGVAKEEATVAVTVAVEEAAVALKAEEEPGLSLEEKKKRHPCFSCSSAHKYARIHLPIAPQCNLSCNYCVRKFDCPNESRPGVTTSVLKPKEALERYIQVKKDVPNLTVVGIAGPGDALANFEETKETLELIRAYDKDVTFCLSTNGLMLPLYAQDIIALGVSHVTITINAVDPKIGGQIYKYVNYLGTIYKGEQAATILMANQLSGLKILADHNILCKVNIVTLKGINDEHIEAVVKKVKELGATITNIMQMIPVEGSVFEGMPLVSNKEIMALRQKCGIHLEQMYHCKQCRADAIGLLDKDLSMHYTVTQKETKKEPEEHISNSYIRFAISSKSGMLIDEHFGHAKSFDIYEYKDGEATFKETRKVEKYCKGADACEEEQDKIENILNTIKDCQCVLTMRIGNVPEMKLAERGIKVFKTYDKIENALQVAAQTLLKESEVQ